MVSFKKEFKEFVLRGNVIDMTVSIIIEGTSGKTVSSLVDGTLMPIIGLFTGGINFTELAYEIKPAELSEFGEEIVPATMLNYGLSIQSVVGFLIIALVISIMARAVNSLRRKHEGPIIPAPKSFGEARLLTEIRSPLDKKR